MYIYTLSIFEMCQQQPQPHVRISYVCLFFSKPSLFFLLLRKNFNTYIICSSPITTTTTMHLTNAHTHTKQQSPMIKLILHSTGSHNNTTRPTTAAAAAAHQQQQQRHQSSLSLSLSVPPASPMRFPSSSSVGAAAAAGESVSQSVSRWLACLLGRSLACHVWAASGRVLLLYVYVDTQIHTQTPTVVSTNDKTTPPPPKTYHNRGQPQPPPPQPQPSAQQQQQQSAPLAPPHQEHRVLAGVGRDGPLAGGATVGGWFCLWGLFTCVTI